MGIQADFDAFSAKLELALEETLLMDVADRARDEIAEAVQSEVYDAYTPKEYVREKAEGGLKDKRNMEATVSGGAEEKILEVADLRMDGGRLIAPIVESGEGYEYDFAYNGVPRPFHSVAEERMGGETLESLIAFGLRARGYEMR